MAQQKKIRGGQQVVYCARCGTSQMLKLRAKPDPCSTCHGAHFSATRTASWKPFAQGWQSKFDRRFLKGLGVCPSDHPDDIEHDPYK